MAFRKFFSEFVCILPRPVYLCAASLLFILIGWHFGWSIRTLAIYFFALMLTALSVIDIRIRLLPDRLTQLLLWGGLLINTADIFTPLSHAVMGAILGYTLSWAVAAGYFQWRQRHGLGGGDIKLIAALGAWLGWQALPSVLIIASLSGSLTALLLAWKHHRSPLYTSIAFGPFLAFAGMLNLLFPQYLSLHLLSMT